MGLVSPLLHFTVWLARVVDESTDVAHPISVDHNTAVQVDTVVMPFVVILLRHTTPELRLAHHFAHVFYNKFTCTQSNAHCSV